MEIYSWNVNGLRAVMKKGFLNFLNEKSPSILCLQEIKCTEYQGIEMNLPFDHSFYFSAEKKGYSGTAILSNIKPLGIKKIQLKDNPIEGRIIEGKFDDFFLVNIYTPNSKSDLSRLKFRQTQWEPSFRKYLKSLEKEKPVIVCGDLNVAHQEIDLANPKTNRKNAGFTDEERGQMDELIKSGFVDTFRHFNPNMENVYTWWSYRAGARKRNVGWRIDYFLCSEVFLPKVKDSKIHYEIEGSDHCPISLSM